MLICTIAMYAGHIGSKMSDRQNRYQKRKLGSFIQMRLIGNIDMTDFIPLNALESALESARAGRSSLPDFFSVFAESDIVVPSGSELMSDGSGFQPLLFDKEGVQMVTCFTAMERIGEFSRVTPYCLKIKGDEFLLRIPVEYGLVVNPGQSVGFDVPPSGVREIIAEFAG
jgi:hypothetical protein